MKSVLLAAMFLVVAHCQPRLAAEGERAYPEMKLLSSHDDQVHELLAQMTLEEKVGQMTQVDQDYLVEEGDIEKYFLGSLLNGGGSDPPSNSFEAWREMYNRYQSRAVKTRLGIPLLYGVDAVHGHSNVVGAVVFPHNIGLGATRNPELVERISRITAKEMRATGFHWNFAPCVAVPRDERWGRTYEGFSEDPELVAELAEAVVRGLQGTGLGDPLGVAACAKHYLADGGTMYGTGPMPRERAWLRSMTVHSPRVSRDREEKWPLDRGDVQLDERTLRRIHLPGYLSAVRAGVATIMPSFNSWNGVKCSGNKYLLTGLLKKELGFEGFLISDWAAINELPGDYKSDIEQSINAGMDMVMVPDKYREFYSGLKELVEAGSIPMSRIDDAVTRILRVKFAMGLMDPGRSPLADPALARDFGSEERREVARDAVRQSLVLLKNEAGALPLAKNAARIHVAGKNADDMGNQCGGWTIQWQGQSGDITPGTTILEAIRKTVSEGTQVTFSVDGTGAEGADAGVVVIGETPYSEWMGDRDDLSLDEEDLAAVAAVKSAGIPVVVILISGRPMIIQPALDNSDAFIAAWLPGTEGQGVADVLFGDYSPSGKLSFSWPRSVQQLPINVGDADYDPLFEYGFGLSY